MTGFELGGERGDLADSYFFPLRDLFVEVAPEAFEAEYFDSWEIYGCGVGPFEVPADVMASVGERLLAMNESALRDFATKRLHFALSPSVDDWLEAVRPLISKAGNGRFVIEPAYTGMEHSQ